MSRKSKTTRLKSEIISDFLNLLDAARIEYQISNEKIETARKITQDMLHEIEFGKTVAERNKSATNLHRVRIDRRYYKDINEEAEVLVNYMEEYKDAVNQLKEALGKMRKVESYHNNSRTYKPRYLPYEETVK